MKMDSILIMRAVQIKENKWIKIHRLLTQSESEFLSLYYGTLEKKENEECFRRQKIEKTTFTWGF